MPPRNDRRCEIEGCDKRHMARGLCSKHYQREFRDPTYQRRWRAANREHNREYMRRWYREHRDSERKRAWRYRVRREYGLELEEYDAIIARGCAICGTHEGRICLDHDHATGKVRDALCQPCNHALGNLADSPSRCRAAAGLPRSTFIRFAGAWSEGDGRMKSPQKKLGRPRVFMHREEAVAMYRAGIPYGQIARRYGISAEAIRKVLVAEGIVMRRRGRARTVKDPVWGKLGFLMYRDPTLDELRGFEMPPGHVRVDVGPGTNKPH